MMRGALPPLTEAGVDSALSLQSYMQKMLTNNSLQIPTKEED
jgi:hypothetical protein